MRGLLWTLLFLLIGVWFVNAEEATSPPITMRGGVICDTEEEVRIYVTEFEVGKATTTSCGFLNRPLIGTVTMLEEYETRKRRYMLARYDFIPNPSGMRVQYGFWGDPIPIKGVSL